MVFVFFFQAEDGIRDLTVTGVQTCALPIWISETVRFLLSVMISTSIAVPPGPYPSYRISSYETPGNSPVPFMIARLMLSAGMFCSLDFWMAVRRRGLPSGSPPPMRADTVISLMSLVKLFPRLESTAAFLCLVVAHLE